MKNLKFTEKASPARGCRFDENGVVVEFDGGAAYRFDADAYRKSVDGQFAALASGEYKAEDLAGLIEAAAAEKRAKDAEYRGAKPPRQPPVLVKALEREGLDWDALEGRLDGFKNLGEAGLGTPEDPPEDFQDLVIESLQGMSFDQRGRRLGPDDADWVDVDAGGKYGRMRFYTKRERPNGVEVWYKALDPALWMGRPAE